MSFALYNELKGIKEQILELVKRIEALEDANEEAKRRRPVLTLPKQKAFNAEN